MKRIGKKICGFAIALAVVGSLVPAVNSVKADSKAAAAAAKIGTTEYATLQAAFDAVPAGTETVVTVTADAMGTASAKLNDDAGKKVVLDLNGHAIASITGPVLQIGKGNSVSVKGAGQIASMGNSAIVNAGTLVVGEVGKDNMTESPNIAGLNYTPAQASTFVVSNADTSEFTLNSGVIGSMEIDLAKAMAGDLSDIKPSTIGLGVQVANKGTFNGGQVINPVMLYATKTTETLVINNGIFDGPILTTIPGLATSITINSGAFRQEQNAMLMQVDTSYNLTPLTLEGNVTIPANCVWAKSGDYNVLHVHKVEKVEAKAATRTEDGNKEYYTCKACGKCYSDAEGTQEITDVSSLVIPANIFVVGENATIDDKIVDEVLATFDEEEVVTLDLKDVDKEVTNVRIPVTGLQKFVDKGGDVVLRIDMPSGLVAGFDIIAMKEMISKSGQDEYVAIEIKTKKVGELNDAQQKALTGADVVTVLSGTVVCNGAELKSFGEGAAAILLPYKFEDSDEYDLICKYVAEDGKTEEILCLTAEDLVYIATEHFSDFAIIKVEEDETPKGDSNTGSTGQTGTGSAGGSSNATVSKPAPTGDNAMMVLWVSLLVVSVGAITTGIIYAKKKNIFK